MNRKGKIKFMLHLSRATTLARRKVSYQTGLTHFKITYLLLCRGIRSGKGLLDLKYKYKLRNLIDRIRFSALHATE